MNLLLQTAFRKDAFVLHHNAMLYVVDCRKCAIFSPMIALLPCLHCLSKIHDNGYVKRTDLVTG